MFAQSVQGTVETFTDTIWRVCACVCVCVRYDDLQPHLVGGTIVDNGLGPCGVEEAQIRSRSSQP